jgi:hypothetical protein
MPALQPRLPVPSRRDRVLQQSVLLLVSDSDQWKIFESHLRQLVRFCRHSFSRQSIVLTFPFYERLGGSFATDASAGTLALASNSRLLAFQARLASPTAARGSERGSNEVSHPNPKL